jgi:haloalkane dehalogenase
MKTEKNKIQWLPILLIAWNLVDIAVHFAVDMVEVLRVSGNVLAIAVAVIVLTGITKSLTHDILVGSAVVVVILNSIFSYQDGFVVPMLVFVGVSVFLMIRWAQIKRLEKEAAAGKVNIRFYHRWWMALALTFVGILIVALVGFAFSPPEAACLDGVDIEIMTTESGVEFVRTPEECFDDLTDWPYEAQYVEIDGMRQAYVDEGSGESGETILLLHGQPSWSYLYRKMIPVLEGAGHRVIAMDHLGMGRSDKPLDPNYYTFQDHVHRLERLIQALELDQAQLTIFVQDWGSLIGLQVVGTHPDWFDRVVVGNGFLPTFEEGSIPFELPRFPLLTRQLFYRNITTIPEQQPDFYDDQGNLLDDNGDFFGIWIDYARNDKRFQASQILEAMTYFDLSEEELAAYDAPFPSRVFMGGPRAFPGLANQLIGVTNPAWESLGEFDKPFLTIWGGNDPGNLGRPEVQAALLDHIPGTEGWDHVRLPEASHFLQDDQGVEIANRVIEFIAASPLESANGSK